MTANNPTIPTASENYIASTYAKTTLQNLQFKQLRHDEIYHSDIGCLRVQARISHHTLMLGKYSGKMIEALIAKGGVNETYVSSIVLDAIIIVMSSANTLNMPLCDIAGAHEDLIGVLNGTRLRGGAETFILGYAVAVGKLAKGAAALDHVEYLDNRASYEKTLKSLWMILLKFWRALADLKLEDALRTRMYAIESKNMFYGEHPNYDNNYQVFSSVRPGVQVY